MHYTLKAIAMFQILHNPYSDIRIEASFSVISKQYPRMAFALIKVIYTGKILLSKIAVGNAKVQQALGTSTIPLILPSTGAQLNSK